QRTREGIRSAALALGSEDFGERTEAARDDLRRRMTTWARAVAERLRRSGVDLGVLFVGRAEAERVLLLRRGARTHEPKASLMLVIDRAGVRTGLELPRALLKTVRERLLDQERAAELFAALEALPEQFSIHVGQEEPIQAPRCGIDDLTRRLDCLDQQGGAMWIGWTVPRDVALEHAALLDEQLEDALVALSRVFVLVVHMPSRGALRAGGQSPRGAKANVGAPIDRGARVRVLEGPFSGKVGVVQELDGKGGARVMLGLLAVRLEEKYLTVHAQGVRRPILTSSHRKPLPARS
ncbi:MAG TPA: KOW motif-containing protein, partial [Polyangiaceae bacterium]|nr:KOW motif-containing protein [Polyangiaceae bacterium]